MSYRESMEVIEGVNGYSIGLLNDSQYSPGSADNPIQYDKFYVDRSHDDYHYLATHGVFLILDGEIQRSVCVCSSGGQTGIHSTGSVIEDDRFLICCGNSVFCLEIDSLGLKWIVKGDHTTCFEIYKYQNDYIVHGELEITRLGRNGNIVWKFSGTDIFTTPTGRDDFKLNGDTIEAVCWDGTKYKISAQTGEFIRIL